MDGYVCNHEKIQKALQGSLCFCKAPVQMFTEREEVERQILVYWKAQRSALWVQKTSTIKDRTQKFDERGEEGNNTLVQT